MTDRELMFLAARAAGYGEPKILDDTSMIVHASRWHPLADDGDAFRLAMALDFHMHHGYTRNRLGPVAFAGDGEQFCLEFHEDFADGKRGAMRRAITRAAAEIGKTMDAPTVAEG